MPDTGKQNPPGAPDDPLRSQLSEFCRIVEALTDAGVEFIVIGGQAETLFGSPRVTLDTDLAYRRTPENLERLARVLLALHPTLRDAPTNLPFIVDARTLKMGMNFTLDTDLGKLDLLGYVDPLGDFDKLAERAESHPFGAIQLRVIALDDLIAVKKHIRRVKDRESLMQLLAIKRIREEQK
jgi:predicted nucleotidyltransferase